jgi:broad specificity phosphatase PhoE
MNGDKFITLAERKKPQIEKYKDNAEAIENINIRFFGASQLEASIKNITGKSISEIWAQDGEEIKPKIKRRIFLVRHGETEKHAEKIFLGQTDVPMSDIGRKQIQEAAKLFKSISPNTDKIYCSKLIRSFESAEIIGDELFEKGFESIIHIQEFNEMNLGAWDGMYISQVKEQFPKDYENRGNDLLTFKIDQSAENYYDLRYRVISKLKKLLTEEKDKDIIIVAHAGVNAAIKSYLEKFDYAETIRSRQENGSIDIIMIND